MFRKMQLFALLLAFALSVPLTPVRAQSQLPVLPKEALVGASLAAMYAPGGDESFWQNSICSGMTAGGCGFFKSSQAGSLWNAGRGAIGDSVTFAEVAAQLKDGSQLWRMSVTIYMGQGKALTREAYAQVVYDQARGQWLLNRVLYGPYIGL
ncbi:MAG: hypothetical protein HYR70_04215 [Chloroflexi bacterium]|nr:hypothetical protein [Chloroflexota bacterium]MBI3340761.1 hypothetical protein [Chloroflexota bacterium]